MKFKVQRQVLEKDVKVLFVVIENVDNKTISEEYIMYRNHKVKQLYEKYKDFNVKEDKILEILVNKKYSLGLGYIFSKKD